MEHTASHCTIELSHGGTVHVGEPMDQVMDRLRAKRADGMRHEDPYVKLERIKGDPAIPRSAKDWLYFEVDAFAVIAVFPIDQGSVPISA